MDIKDFEPLFGSWYVESLIGSGSFGKVYKIKREEFGAVYYSALKWISIPRDDAEMKHLRYDGLDNESISEYYKDVVTDLVNEMQLMSRLRGRSSIVSYEDHSVVPKSNNMGYDIFIRMELLISLNDYMQTHELSRADVIRLGINLCEALELCQKYNIIHRDIKPDNIFVAETGEFKLGDFGIARQLEKTTASLSIKGTYYYMAPEVYKGERYNSSADTYSLGIVLYRLLNDGRLPFLPLNPASVRQKDRDQSLVRRMSGEQMVPPQNTEGRLGDIVLKACAYDPKDRYSSPRQMREELQAIQIPIDDVRFVYKDGDNLGRLELSNNRVTDPDMTVITTEIEKVMPSAHYTDFLVASQIVDSNSQFFSSETKESTSNHDNPITASNLSADSERFQIQNADEGSLVCQSEGIGNIAFCDKDSGKASNYTNRNMSQNSEAEAVNNKKIVEGSKSRSTFIIASVFVILAIFAWLFASGTIGAPEAPVYERTGQVFFIDESTNNLCSMNIADFSINVVNQNPCVSVIDGKDGTIYYQKIEKFDDQGAGYMAPGIYRADYNGTNEQIVSNTNKFDTMYGADFYIYGENLYENSTYRMNRGSNSVEQILPLALGSIYPHNGWVYGLSENTDGYRFYRFMESDPTDSIEMLSERSLTAGGVDAAGNLYLTEIIWEEKGKSWTNGTIYSIYPGTLEINAVEGVGQGVNSILGVIGDYIYYNDYYSIYRTNLLTHNTETISKIPINLLNVIYIDNDYIIYSDTTYSSGDLIWFRVWLLRTDGSTAREIQVPSGGS